MKKSFSVLAISFLFMSVSIPGSPILAQSSEKTVVKWLDTKQLATIVMSDFQDFFELMSNTSLASNDRWEEFWETVCHSENGVLNREELDEVENLKNEFIEKIQPNEFVFSIPVENQFSWSAILRCDNAVKADDVVELMNSWRKLKDSNDFLSSRSGGRKKGSRNEMQQRQSDKKTATSAEPLIEKIGEIEIRKSDKVYFFATDDLIVFSNLQSLATRLARRISGDDKNYRRLVDSRKYKLMRSRLKTKHQTKHLELHVNPAVAGLFLNWFDKDSQRIWGANEILGIGMSINLVPSRENAEKVEVVVEGFVATSTPRHGLAKAIKLKGSPEKLPFVTDEVCAFYYVNMDWTEYANERRRLYNMDNGPNSFEARNNSNKLSKTIGEEIRQKNRDLLGTIQGTCWFEAKDGKIKSLTFRDVKDVEAQIETIIEMTSRGSQVASNFGFERGTIAGFPALTSNSSSRDGKMGIVFVDNFTMMSDVSSLEKFCDAGPTDQYPESVENALQNLFAHSSIPDDRSIVVAITPKGWDLITQTQLYNSVVRRFSNDLKTKGSTADMGKAAVQLKKLFKRIQESGFSEPKSKSQAMRNARLILNRIFSDSIGSFILLANDSGKGFRFAAMTIPEEKPKNE